jgi:phospholipase/carboxylesterase
MALHIATRYPQTFAGVIALSCYLPVARELPAAHNAANLGTPIFMAHGSQDPVVPIALGEFSREALEAVGYGVEWHTYLMPHSLCPEEVAHLKAWLASRLNAG